MFLRHCVKKFEDIPGPPRYPIIGNLYLYMTGKYEVTNYHKVLENLYELYGPVVRQDLGTTTTIHIFDPHDVQTVYRNEGHTPYVVPLLETAKQYREKRELSLGLGNTNGEEWYRLRSAVRKMMLRPAEVHHYLPMAQEVANNFVSRIKEKKNSEGEVNHLYMEAGKWALESAGFICFERSLGCMSGCKTEAECEAMITANRIIFEISAKLKFSLPIYKYIPTPKWTRLLAAEDLFYKKSLSYITSTIQKVQEDIKENKSLDGKYNFLYYLLSREELSMQDVIIISLSMFTDGLSTTVPALMYNLYCLAANPEVQENVFKELISVLGKDGKVTVDKLNKLPYLKATVKETFRFYPVGTEVSRIINKDLVLSGFEIPKGTRLDLSTNVHFQNEMYFKNASTFEPKRWIRSRDRDVIHPYILTPFGHGTRTCAGRRFAEQDLYVVMCSILQKYHLKSAYTTHMQQMYHTLLFPKGPIRIQFIPR